MKKNRLFLRMFMAFVAIMLVTALVLSLLMVVMVRGERARALEDALRVQARDVARLMQQQYDVSWFWSRNAAVSEILSWKISEIRQTYGADVWIVSSAGIVLVLGSNVYAQEQLNDEAVIEQLGKVLSGEEIRVQGLIRELGEHMVTIGVPFLDRAYRVGGAVLLHISTQSLSVDYTDLIRNAAVAASAALVLGALLAFVIAKRQTDPIRQIRLAVVDFAAGKLNRRVVVNADEELSELANAFNHMAEDLSNLEASRRSFVANVSHELRSPLTCIRGYVEGMLDGVIVEDEREKYLHVVLSETKRLTKLVGELLDLTRIESGNMPLSYAPLDLSELLRLELIKFEGRIDEKQLNVTVELPDEPLTARADEGAVRQVVTNLLDNAVKFAHGRIALKAEPAGGRCRVTVSNDGDPIDESDIAHIFDRFYKADKAHTSGNGTGLGLAIAKKILEQMGQRIWVTSDALETAFSFTLDKAE